MSMAATLGCIADEEIHLQWDAGQIEGESLGRKDTPFGESGDIFRVHAGDVPFYLLARCGSGMEKSAPHRANSRANLYALKDLGADCVLGWGSGGAITHNISVGDLVILSDLMDMTHLRDATFFEDVPLGQLRQFPVFCPQLRQMIGKVMEDMKLIHHGTGTAAVREGPRLETPAEVRMLITIGAEIVTHTFVPEMFLAKELQMGYAAVCYVVNYAETGSRYQPFAPGGLFGNLTNESERDRGAGAVGAVTRIASNLAGLVANLDTSKCSPCKTQTEHIREYNLPADWREWFKRRRR